MNKLTFGIILLSTSALCACPDYSKQKDYVSKYLETMEQSQTREHRLELVSSCNDTELTSASFHLYLDSDQSSPGDHLIFELAQTTNESERYFSHQQKIYTVDFNSNNPILNLVALSKNSDIQKIKDKVAVAFKLMLNTPIPNLQKLETRSRYGAPAPVIGDFPIRLGTSQDKNYDYFLLTGDGDSTKSQIQIKHSGITKRRTNKASRPYALKGTLHQKDLDVYNKDFNGLINYFKDELDAEIKKQSEIAVADLIDDTKDKTVKVLKLIELKHNLFEATPGIDLVEGDTVELAYPAGDSSLYLKVKLRIRIKTDYFRKTTNITVKIKNLKVTDLIHFTPKEDGSVSVHIPEDVDVKGSVDIDFSNDVLNFVVSAIECTLDPLSKRFRKIVGKALRDNSKEDLDKIVKATNHPFGKDLEIEEPYSAPVNNKFQIVEKIENKIFMHHLAESTIQYPFLKPADQLTWLDYEDLDLTKLSYNSASISVDGAIWTGTLLTSMALKYSVTQRGRDLQRINSLIDKLNILATINGAGPLARNAIPEDSKWYKQVMSHGRLHTFRSKVIDGRTWHSFQGEKGVSRDQYMGVMTGLINTYMYIDDPMIKNKAKKVYKHLLDYLIGTKWIIHEDHKGNLFDDSKERSLPTHYAANGLHKFTYLLAAMTMYPENKKYKREYNRFLPLVKMVWFNDYISSLEPLDEYYSFNLKHTLYLTLAKILKDKQIIKHFSKSLKVLEHFIGHHKNPYFSAIRLYAANQFNIELNTVEMKEDITRNYNGAFYRAHNMNMATEQEKELAQVYYEKRITAHTLGGTPLVRVPSPIPPRFRYSELDFLWQRSPFIPVNMRNNTFTSGNISGLDLHIVYWLLEAANI